MPTLIVSWANTPVVALATRPAATSPVRNIEPNFIPLLLVLPDGYPRREPREREPCQLARRPGKSALVGSQDQRSASHHQPAQSLQTQVAGEPLYNPAESQTHPLEQGGGGQEAQYVA